MEIIRQFTISSERDLLSLNIIDFHRLNGYWRNPSEAMDTILSWFKGTAIATEVFIPNYFDAPKRDDFPSDWDHPSWGRDGNGHQEVARGYWNWFKWNHEDGELSLSDSPDFQGTFGDGSRFWGDFGRVSASAFAMSQKCLRDHDLWITVKDDNGDKKGNQYHVLIEPQVSILKLYSEMFKIKVRNNE